MFLGISKAPSAAVGLSVKAIESAEARAVVSLFVWRAALAWAMMNSFKFIRFECREKLPFSVSFLKT